MLNSRFLRNKFFEFFKSKSHVILPSAPLIPKDDPTVLFINAGMQPLIPYFIETPHPAGKRLANAQKCIRLQDIDEVGDRIHDTFFEMLGNWSLGDYFKKESIKWSFEFLTGIEWLGIDPDKLYVTVFAGDKEVPLDEESIKLWQEQFAIYDISAEVYDSKKSDNSKARIFPLGVKDNWWKPGPVGPCGPDTEIFYYIGNDKPDFDHERPGFNDDNFIELWNNVFMRFYRDKDAVLTNLDQKNIDTGMGFERVVMVLENKKDIFSTYLFKPMIKVLENMSGYEYNEDINLEQTRIMRIIADHVRTVTFILADDAKIQPSNVDQGYVARRLLRRAIFFCDKLGITTEKSVCSRLALIVADNYKHFYEELKRNQNFVLEQIQLEEDKFEKTLTQGRKEFEKVLNRYKETGESEISGHDVFTLFSTYGFPFELTKELAQEHGLSINKDQFESEFKKHQKLSRAGAEKKFKGGLAGREQIHKRYHTATHLLHQALKMVLGNDVMQKGSNITEERLRFDFSYPKKLTQKEIKQIEDIVNNAIQSALPVICEEMTIKEAKEKSAIGLFDEKYGEKVNVYSIGGFSKEICGGPHVQNTSELGKFKIIKEESSSANVRRIKAVLK
jgi:alanyl-tRNA synthetase